MGDRSDSRSPNHSPPLPTPRDSVDTAASSRATSTPTASDRDGSEMGRDLPADPRTTRRVNDHRRRLAWSLRWTLFPS